MELEQHIIELTVKSYSLKMKMKMTTFSLLLLLFFTKPIECAKILALMPAGGFFVQNILFDRGEVVYIALLLFH